MGRAVAATTEPTADELRARMFAALVEFRRAHDRLMHRKEPPSAFVTALRDRAADLLHDEGVDYEVEVSR